MVNGLTAVTGFDAAALWSSPTAAKIMVQLASEAATVAQHQGRAMAPIYLPASGAGIPASLLLRTDDPAVLDELCGLIADNFRFRRVTFRFNIDMRSVVLSLEVVLSVEVTLPPANFL